MPIAVDLERKATKQTNSDPEGQIFLYHPFVYLSHRLVWVCEIELSHMGKNKGNPDLVCEKLEYHTIELHWHEQAWNHEKLF